MNVHDILRTTQNVSFYTGHTVYIYILVNHFIFENRIDFEWVGFPENDVICKNISTVTPISIREHLNQSALHAATYFLQLNWFTSELLNMKPIKLRINDVM